MHTPVLLKETLEWLDLSERKQIFDGTVGFGGHTIAILEADKQTKVLGADLDQTSLEKLKELLVQKGLDQRCKLVQGNYRDIDNLINENDFLPDGILVDLGFSSFQLDNAQRGFSFQSEGPLDMRYDLSAQLTAEEVVNRYQEQDLQKIFSEYGEEKFFRRIARKIIESRKEKAIKTTAELADTIRLAIPAPIRFKAADNIRRIFQAIRIEVNGELDNLKEFLPKALSVLKPGGRLLVISFHSLEDRIVKEFFVKEAKGCVCPPEFPECICGHTKNLRILTRKPIVAQEEESIKNPRSKPAKLRVAEKIVPNKN